MAAHKGDKVKIKKAGVVICSGINQKDISLGAETIDDTANSNRGFSVFLNEADTRSITLSFKGIAKDRVLRKLRIAGNNLLTAVTYEFANGDTITGNFIITDYSESGTHKDAVQFSCSLHSSGPYTASWSASETDNGGVGGGSGGGGGGASRGVQSFVYESGSDDAWGCYPFADTNSTPHGVLGCQSGSIFGFFALGGDGSITPNSVWEFPGIAFGWVRGIDDSCYAWLCLDESTGDENFVINGGPVFMNGKKTVEAAYVSVNGRASSSTHPKKSAFFWSIGAFDFSMYSQWYGSTAIEIEDLG